MLEKANIKFFSTLDTRINLIQEWKNEYYYDSSITNLQEKLALSNVMITHFENLKKAHLKNDKKLIITLLQEYTYLIEIAIEILELEENLQCR